MEWLSSKIESGSITPKTQAISQNSLMFVGSLFARHSLGYNYKSSETGKHFQLPTIMEDMRYKEWNNKLQELQTVLAYKEQLRI